MTRFGSRLLRLRRPGRPSAPGRDAHFDRRLILPMLVGSVLNPVNSSMLAVALVPIGVAFGAPPSQTVWLVSGLYLATAVGQPVLGRLVDRYGPRRLYLAGAALVDADSPIWLLVAIAVIVGAPQGLNGLANQNALYFQADPARMGSSAGLLRTFTYLGALTASAATAGFFGQRADTAGLHDLALFLIAVATTLLAVILLDRSLGRITTEDASGRR